jgi:LysM repeat protein
MVLTAHIVLLGGMLLQGCKDTSEVPSDSNSTSSTNSTNTSYAADTNANPETTPSASNTAQTNDRSPAGQSAGQQSALPQPTTPIQPPPSVTSDVPPAPTTPSVDYVVARGDTFGNIAKRQHISLNALVEANPGVNARKLKIGQKLQIPAATTAVSTTSSAASAVDTAEASTSVYVVKPGDTLSKIARLHRTSSKKIMALNGLNTKVVRVGQKLKMPVS